MEDLQASTYCHYGNHFNFKVYIRFPGIPAVKVTVIPRRNMVEFHARLFNLHVRRYTSRRETHRIRYHNTQPGWQVLVFTHIKY